MNKRIAFLLSGQYRNFNDNIHSVKKNFYKFNNIDFYISTWDDPGSFDKLKIFKLFRKKNGLPINLLNQFIPFKNLPKYILISKDNIYLTKKINKITPSFIESLPIKFKCYDIRNFKEEFHHELDNNFIPKSLKEAEPIYYRGFLPQLNRNSMGLKMILKYEKENNIQYDYIFRSQSEVFFDDNFFEYIYPLLTRYDFLYSPITIDSRFQVSSKFFFGKRNAVVNFLNADEEFFNYISSNLMTDFKRIKWKDIPIGERFFKQINHKYNQFKYKCLELPIQINRQNFIPNKPYWILEKNFINSNFNPIIEYN